MVCCKKIKIPLCRKYDQYFFIQKQQPEQLLSVMKKYLDQSRGIITDPSLTPQYMIFQYSPFMRHIRIQQIEKIPLKQQQTFYGFHQQYGQANNDLCQFKPANCRMLDACLSTIEKSESETLDYSKGYKKKLRKYFKNRIFNWYDSSHQPEHIHSQICYGESREYNSYKQIDDFCFGRKFFVRPMNSMGIASDHVSRDHCRISYQPIGREGSTQKQFNSKTGTSISKILRSKLALGSCSSTIQSKITSQLWELIQSYLYCQKDKYLIYDCGSRNGTFFIEVPEHFPYPLNKSQLQQKRVHCLKLKDKYGYQFEGQDYLIKILRMSKSNRAYSSDIPKQENVTKSSTQPNSNLIHNLHVYQILQQFKHKTTYYNNYNKIEREFLIDEQLFMSKSQLNASSLQQQQENYGFDHSADLNIQEFLNSLDVQVSNLKQPTTQAAVQKQKQQQQQKQPLLDLHSQRLQILVISINFNTEFQKYYCLVTKHNSFKRFAIGYLMGINTSRAEYNQNGKCNGFITYNEQGWVISTNPVSLSHIYENAAVSKSLNSIKVTSDQSPLRDFGQSDSHSSDASQMSERDAYIEMKAVKKKAGKDKVSLSKHDYSDFGPRYLKNRIWTKVPSKTIHALQPQKVPSYILRCAHSFYFKIDFINFYTY